MTSFRRISAIISDYAAVLARAMDNWRGDGGCWCGVVRVGTRVEGVDLKERGTREVVFEEGRAVLRGGVFGCRATKKGTNAGVRMYCAEQAGSTEKGAFASERPRWLQLPGGLES